MMSIVARSMADRIVTTQEHGPSPDRNMPKFFEDRKAKVELESDPFTYIVDAEGKIISSDPRRGPMDQQLYPSILENDNTIQELAIKDKNFYAVKAPIEVDETIIGWVVMIESEQNLSRVNQEYTQLAIMIISLALLGWAAIYILSNRLSKPIKDVANAAILVAEGNYQIELPDQSKEKEVHELIHSFKEMTIKLEKLESLRTELLAGVTHELKTPVTSISGLLQAIKDDVVTGDEAKEFLTISLNETEKMKKMVEDLLAFNQFATNAVQVNKAMHSTHDIVEEAVYSWKVAQDNGSMQIELSLPEKPTQISIDPIRFQQIMTNLLNNATQAMLNQGQISITVTEQETEIMIDVTDTGNGIPENEQPFIFERFYRGKGKKYKVRGLGLGLSLSKMIAQALDGDLVLQKSSSDGTTFRIYLPKDNS